MATNVTNAAETNLITATKMKRAREIDFTLQFAHGSLAKFIEVLGVTRKIPMMEGTTMYLYTTKAATSNPHSGSVPEGEIIPLSQYEQTKTAIGEITLKKWRKAVSAEAIKKSGYDSAVTETDAALLRDLQKGIRTDLFTLLNGSITGSTTATGVGLQAALANAWGALQVAFEDDTAEAVYFVNPTDVAEYLGKAEISTQTAFGMNYITNFLGLGTVIMSSQITAGTFVATAKQNLVMYYLTMTGDIARAFELTTDETGYVGIKSGYSNEERAQIESLVMSGVQFFVEYAGGVVKGTIDGVLIDLTVNSAAGASSGKTAITYSGYDLGTGDTLGYKVTNDEIVVRKDDASTGYTSWDGSADITAATGKVLTLVVINDSKVKAAGHTTVTAKA